MIQFPETAATEWQIIAEAAQATVAVRRRIERDTKVESEVERLRVRHEAGLMFQQELDADETPELEMFTLTNYNTGTALAAPTDLIEGVVKDKGLTIMLGPSTSGKSTTVLQMLNSLATGEDFLGQKVQQISGSVGAVSYDMDASLMMDWMAGFPNLDPNKVSVVNAHKRGNPLGVPALRAQIVAAWQAMSVEVVAIDSFGASFFAHDQNDAGATMAHYRDLMKFALTEVGARAVIIIVHSTASSPDKARGSTVHHDVADTIIAQSVDDKTQSRHLRMVKYRQHRDATTGSMTSSMTPTVITAPDSVTHLVSLDPGAMVLAGYPLPVGVAALAFPDDLPEASEAPNTDSEEDWEEDV